MRTTRSTTIAVLSVLALASAACALSSEDAPTTPETTAATTPETSATEAPLPQGSPSPELPTDVESGTASDAGQAKAGDDDAPQAPAPPEPPAPAGTPETPATPAVPSPSLPPKPTKTCPVTKDAAGFFTRSSALGSYVAYVPPSYDGSKPLPVVVGMHGCGDDAYNYATWGVAPYDTRATQPYIAVSVGSETGANRCWSMGGDDAKVLAAVDDVASCFWTDSKKVTVSGFSSGGQLAYRVGLEHADRFAGIAIACSGLYAAGDATKLLAGAARKIPIAHRAHTGDTVFPLAKVKADWQQLTAAGFPLVTSEVSGGHDGSSADWTGFLLPRAAGFALP